MGGVDRRTILVTALLLSLALCASAMGNEAIRRAAQKASRKSRRLLLGAERRLFPMQLPPALTVAEFVADLSEEELTGWRRMRRYSSAGYLQTRLSPALREELGPFVTGD